MANEKFSKTIKSVCPHCKKILRETKTEYELPQEFIKIFKSLLERN